MKGGTLVPGAMGILSCHVARQPRQKFDAPFGIPGSRVKKFDALFGAPGSRVKKLTLLSGLPEAVSKS